MKTRASWIIAALLATATARAQWATNATAAAVGWAVQQGVAQQAAMDGISLSMRGEIVRWELPCVPPPKGYCSVPANQVAAVALLNAGEPENIKAAAESDATAARQSPLRTAVTEHLAELRVAALSNDPKQIGPALAKVLDWIAATENRVAANETKAGASDFTGAAGLHGNTK